MMNLGELGMKLTLSLELGTRGEGSYQLYNWQNWAGYVGWPIWY